MKGEYLGIDIGGTSFDMGIVKEGELVSKTQSPVNANLSEYALIEDLYALIDSLFHENIRGIGVGVPGVVDTEQGIIYDIQNIPAWKEVSLQKKLEERYKVAVRINNDANCFALGEYYFGNGTKYDNFVTLSIGTGLGMGVIINNDLYEGVLCGAGEIGMLPYKDGIVEEFAGSFFFSRTYGKSAKELHDLALKNDTEGVKAFEEFGEHLGEAIKMILFMYAPEAIILGGSISKAFPQFESYMIKTVQTFPYKKQIKKLIITPSTVKNIAILGAASLSFKL